MIRVAFTLLNGSDADIVVNQQALERAFRIGGAARERLSGGRTISGELPLTARWSPDIRLFLEWVPVVRSAPSLLVTSRTGLSWLVDIERADGAAFLPGEYAIEFQLVDLQAAVRGRNYAAAADAYSRAVAADPGSLTAQSGLAGAYLMLGRYAEAIRIYEPMLPAATSESLTFSSLAMAYLAIGDEPNARRVLRMTGLTADRVDAEVTRLRDVNRRRR